jgi:CubicO group peptidase (beta-lactamase class C family)
MDPQPTCTAGSNPALCTVASAPPVAYVGFISLIVLHGRKPMQRMLASVSLAAAVVLSLTVPHAASAQQAQAAPVGGDVVQGMSRERLGRIAGVMKQEVAKGTFAGAVTLIARRGEVVHFEAHGFQDAAKLSRWPRTAYFAWHR